MSDVTHSDWHLTKRLVGYMARERVAFWFSFLLYPIGAAAVAAPPYITQQILDIALPARDVSLVNILVGLFFLALVVEFVSGFLSQYILTVLGQRAMAALRTDLFRHVQRLPASYFDRHPVGRILTRLTNDIESLAEVFASGAITAVADVVTVIVVICLMLWLDVRLTLYALLVVPPLLVVATWFQRLAREAFREIRVHIAKINVFLAEHIGGMGVVQAFLQEERCAKHFDVLNIDYRDSNRRAVFYDAALFSVVEAIGTTAVAAMIWFGSGKTSAGVLQLGVLVAFIQYIRRCFVPIRDLSQKYTVLQSALASSERIFAMLDEPVALDEMPNARAIQKLHQSIAMDHVWFSYATPPTDESWILKDVSLAIGAREHVALVGETGSGKTTIGKLLNRFYDVQQGAVLVDGIDIKTVRLADLRRLFAVVLQDVYLFSGTILENLTLGGRISEASVKDAAKSIGIETWIASLPHGYETLLQEFGSNLSSGERQLLALVRALAIDPAVLIMDEATSNVDSETEAMIQRGLEVVMRGRAALVIAHRLSTVQKMDRIVVLQRGRIQDEGSHTVLMGRDGYYRNLVEAQFRDDRAGL